MKTTIKLLLTLGLLSLGQAFAQNYVSVQTQTVVPAVADFKEQVSKEILSPPELKIHNKRPKDKMILPEYDAPKDNVRLFQGQPKVSLPQIAVAPPAPSVGFVGLIDNNTSIPPDVNGAVGPNHVMTTLNTEIKIQNKTGGAVSSLSNEGFWTVEETFDIYDPKILFDPFTQRYYFVDLDGAYSATSNILLAVSATSDPTGAWHQYKIKTNTGELGIWFDFPSMGYNKDWLVVSGNMFTMAGSFSKVKLFVIKKSDILAGLSTTPTEISVTSGFTISPAVVADNTTNTVPLICTWSSSSGLYKVFKISGVPPAVPTLSDVGLPSVGSGNSWSGYTPNYNQAPQLGMTSATNGMDDGDHRMSNAVLKGGKLWAVHNTWSISSGVYRGVVRWLSINPTTAAINEWGKIEDTGITNMGSYSVPTNSYSYPSIAVNNNQDVMIGFGHHSPTIYGTASYVLRKNGDANFSSVYQYKNGTNKYFKTYSGSANRWGDYTMTMVDPSNGTDFWVIGEYADAPGGGYDKWGTYWAKIQPNPVVASIVLGTLPSSTLCANKGYAVPFSITGTFNAGNQFKTQISNASGSFSSPLQIGSLTSVSAGNIASTVPNSVTPGGTGYKLRIVSTNPVVTSTSTANVTIIPQNRAIGSGTTTPYEATEKITNSGTLNLTGTREFKAGKSITLTPTPGAAITIPNTSVFTARIVGCVY
ncbi:hypothetical protein EGI22_16800 [Lacihabitans sp. LS3-19]|uniref:hypothetical protein n=1 Tax=Lacihabitans sp. LS3-19 TaxID=2487335 RepID=UPI0020CB80A0|nr:hypothetical protein [Lacihabitans sp. LS3-19]MCP9769563.1 hypothetical protein [Lacihabitans sp. LS3-19]